MTVVVLGCGKKNSPTGPSGSSATGTNTYLGVLNVSGGSDLGGTIQLSIPKSALTELRQDADTALAWALALAAPVVHAQASVAVTGTLVTTSGIVVPLAGTYAGGVINVTGGGYIITATLNGDRALSGTGTAPGGMSAGLTAAPSPAAPQPAPANPSGTYTGSFRIDTIETYSTTHPNQSVPYSTCTVAVAITGTLKLIVTNTGNGQVNGDLSSNWAETPGTTTCNFGFAAVARNTGLDYDGPPANLQFGLSESGLDGFENVTRVQGFSGVISGNTVIGTVFRSLYITSKSQLGSGPDDVKISFPTVSTTVTLTK